LVSTLPAKVLVPERMSVPAETVTLLPSVDVPGSS